MTQKVAPPSAFPSIDSKQTPSGGSNLFEEINIDDGKTDEEKKLEIEQRKERLRKQRDLIL